MITFTYPHIGNYGTTSVDDESSAPACRGIVVRDMARRSSSWRSDLYLEAFLVRHNVAGMTGVDTRRLTCHIREAGAMPCAFGTASETELKAAAVAEPGTDGIDLVATVTTANRYTIEGVGPRRIVAYDYGIKRMILRHLSELGTVEVVPASTPAAEVLDMAPDGVFLSNGPGDPAAVSYASDAIGAFSARCRSSASALAINSSGRRSAPEPSNCSSAITAGTILCNASRPEPSRSPARITTTPSTRQPSRAWRSPTATSTTASSKASAAANVPAFSVQYHPEAGPGPHDARYLFEQFADLMDKGH